MAKQPSKKGLPHETADGARVQCEKCSALRHQAAQTTRRAVPGCNCGICRSLRRQAEEMKRNRATLSGLKAYVASMPVTRPLRDPHPAPVREIDPGLSGREIGRQRE
jgi:hypothetical protein